MQIRLTLLGFILLAACSSSGPKYETTVTGLQYHYFEKTDGPKGKIGDYYDLNVEFRKMDDSVFLVTKNSIRLNEGVTVGGLPHSIAQMSKGDSAVFIYSIDSIYKEVNLPASSFLANDSTIKIHVRVTDIVDEYAINLRLLQKEERDINNFIEQNGWNVAIDSATGIRYEITKPVLDGRPVEDGDQVGITYYYYTIDGNPIARIRDGDLRPMTIGDEKELPAWSVILKKCKEGEAIRAIIPFDQAFGANGMVPQVPPYATLVIETEVVELNKSADEKIDLLN